MELHIQSIEPDGVVRLGAGHALTASTMHTDEQHPLAAVIGEQWAGNRVMLDLSHTEMMDSAVIGWLFECQRKFERYGGRLVVHSVTAEVQQMFEFVNVASILHVAADDQEALQMAREGPS